MAKMVKIDEWATAISTNETALPGVTNEVN